MNIRRADAYNFFSSGGYYDMHTQKYIAPKWISDKGARYDTGLSEEEYRRMDSDVSRYLSSPVFRFEKFFRALAKRMGISDEIMNAMGFDQDVPTLSIYLSPEESARWRTCAYSEDQWKARETFVDYIRAQKLYSEYLKETEKLEWDLIRTWLAERGIKIVN